MGMAGFKTLKFIATPEKGKVSAFMLRPDDAQAMLLLAHGAGTDMQHSSMEELSQALAERGIATFRYNFPYKEAGGGPPNPRPILTATVRAAVEAAGESAGDLPLFAGGRSMGGRMTSLAASEAALPNVRGIILFGFPLHSPGKPDTSRAEHFAKVSVPMLFLQGPRDEMAEPELLNPIIERLGKGAKLHTVEGADHSFKVLKRSGRTAEEVLTELADTAAEWIGQLI